MSRAIFRDAKNRRRFGLGSGPSGCPKARSRRFDAGVGPVGLPEKTFSATVEASATAWEGRVARARRLKLPRQPWQTRAVARARSVVLALGAGSSGFPKQFPGDGQSICDSLPRARFRRFAAGGWPDGGFPKQVSER